jgi:hypothetical protein
LNVLATKKIIDNIQGTRVAETRDRVQKKRMDIAESMDGSAKVSTVMNKRILDGAETEEERITMHKNRRPISK